MTFNEKKKEHIDKESFRILELFEETDEKKTKPNSDKGSLGHQILFDFTDKVIDSPTLISTTLLNTTISVKECYNGKCIGLNESNYKEFQKLIATIYKDKEINAKVSEEFIEHKSLEWLLKTFKQKKADCNFSTFILDEMQNSIEELKVHYSMLYLDIGKPFQIGKVKFEFFTKEFFETLAKQYQSKHPEKDENPFEQMRSHYQGKVYATYIVSAEREKAKEIALEECSLAVDILKMCSETTDLPPMKLSFDIDSRTRENVQNEVILTRPSATIETFSINSYRLPSHHKIYDQEWDRIVSRQLADFHNFLLTLADERTELEQLIINGIKRYGNAISNNNMHQRIVELFTILESLLLSDKNSPIIESVCKYCSKLVFKLPTDRKHLISLLKTMYEVRSDLIHHAKETFFDIDNLQKLQYTVIMLLANLIKKTNSHKNKQSLLQEIDEAILNAY
ncbi:MAG: HEPN domain-containing protein [Bacteroidales bacterium]|nr:HEPN domain-containing protein [Bacteroidales bacterium]